MVLVSPPWIRFFHIASIDPQNVTLDFQLGEIFRVFEMSQKY